MRSDGASSKRRGGDATRGWRSDFDGLDLGVGLGSARGGETERTWNRMMAKAARQMP